MQDSDSHVIGQRFLQKAYHLHIPLTLQEYLVVYKEGDIYLNGHMTR